MEHISKYLPATVTEKKELQKQEQGLPLVGDERRFEVSLQSKFLKDATFEEVKEVLRYVMMKIGLRAQNWPTDIEKLLLYEHLVSNFGGNRIDEIKLAFDMAIGGKFDKVEVNCYENFSCYYFSTIMNAYRYWASQTYRQVVKDVNVEQKIFTQEELDNSAREDVERQYILMLKGITPKAIEINKAILVKDGLMKEDEKIEDFFKQSYEKGYRHLYIKQQS